MNEQPKTITREDYDAANDLITDSNSAGEVRGMLKEDTGQGHLPIEQTTWLIQEPDGKITPTEGNRLGADQFPSDQQVASMAKRVVQDEVEAHSEASWRNPKSSEQ